MPTAKRWLRLIGHENYGSSNFTGVDRSHLRPQTKVQGTQAISAGAHAGAVVPLQSGVRWLRENSVSRARAENAAHARRMLPGGRGVRRSDGGDPGWRALAAPADRRNCRGLGRAQEVHLSVYQRSIIETEDSSLQTQQ